MLREERIDSFSGRNYKKGRTQTQNTTSQRTYHSAVSRSHEEAEEEQTAANERETLDDSELRAGNVAGL
jgi:hypothetical protein